MTQWPWIMVVAAAVLTGRAEGQLRKLIEIEGVGEQYSGRLVKAGIPTPLKLLDFGATRSGRERLAVVVGVSPATILKWVNRVDLSRVKGVGTQYGDLLEKAGVDTPKELAGRNPDALVAALTEANTKAPKPLVRKVPARSTVARWIAAAKLVPEKVQY